MSAFPTLRSTPAVPVSADTAHKYLQTYLEATESSPYLLPNARLEPSGPTAGSSNSSVTIYNLKRVEAGLRGEWLAPSLELEENVPATEGPSDEMGNKEQVEGWQDLDEYQREQEVIEGEVGPRETVLAQEGDSEIENELAVEAPPPSKKDKEQRKREKKLRSKEDKRRKSEKKHNGGSEE